MLLATGCGRPPILVRIAPVALSHSNWSRIALLFRQMTKQLCRLPADPVFCARDPPQGYAASIWRRCKPHGKAERLHSNLLLPGYQSLCMSSWGMSMTEPRSCEVKIQGAWRAISLDEAAADHASAIKRCPACHGRVVVTAAYSGPNVRRSLSHRKAHNGCPLIARLYSGFAAPHPQPLA